MRRSAAPSQAGFSVSRKPVEIAGVSISASSDSVKYTIPKRAGSPNDHSIAAKRPCFNGSSAATTKPSSNVFTPPVKATDRVNIFTAMQVPLPNLSESVSDSRVLPATSASAASDGRRSALEILQLIKGTSSKEETQDISNNIHNSDLLKSSKILSTSATCSDSTSYTAVESTPLSQFTVPQLSTRTGENGKPTSSMKSSTPSATASETTDVATPSRYLSVMWAKLSKKKHKTWEGDAILIATGRTVQLVDLEGKEIARGSGYKTAELQTLCDGQMLVIGGKEIEVMGVLSEEQYRSGACFNASNEVGVEAVQTKPVESTRPAPATSVASKRFVCPDKEGSRSGIIESFKRSQEALRPQFDPSAPNALVMPRPSDSHQWQHNMAHLPIVDVVVDPHIVRQLRPHQREGVTFLYQCLLGMRAYRGFGAILADEMGLGKTLQCIAVIWTMYKQGPYAGRPLVKRILIITPGSLVKNWCKEFKKWLSSERLQVFAVGPDKKVEDFIDSPVYPVLIISYEMFVRSVELLRKVKFDLLVCDEGHRLKNSNIKTSTLMTSLQVQRRIVMTGTPLQNDLQELYAIADFTNPGILGTFGAFRRVYEDPILASRQPNATPEETKLGQNRNAELNRITSMFILRRTQEINNQYLPARVDLVLFCGLTDLQRNLYKTILASRVVRSCLGGGSANGNTAQHLCCISALKKLCNHPQLIYDDACKAADVSIAASTSRSSSDGSSFENASTHNKLCSVIKEALGNLDLRLTCLDLRLTCTCQLFSSLVVKALKAKPALYDGLLRLYPKEFSSQPSDTIYSGKLQVLEMLLSSFHKALPTERVVVVSNYAKTLNLIEELCKKSSYDYLRLDGQTATAKRMELVDRFNNRHSSCFVFLLSTKAGGVGLNLVGASRLVLYDIDWNPATDLQAMARVWRDGQVRRTFVYRLLSTGSLEEKMYQRQISKQDLSGLIVDSKSNNIKQSFTPEQLRELFFLCETTLCSTHDLLNCYCKDGREKMASTAADKSPTSTNARSRPSSSSSIARSCQIQPNRRLSDHIQKNMCMDELLDWKHVAGPSPDLSLVDPLMPNDVHLNVTYAFWTESNCKPTAGSGIPFSTSDTSSSEGTLNGHCQSESKLANTSPSTSPSKPSCKTGSTPPSITARKSPSASPSKSPSTSQNKLSCKTASTAPSKLPNKPLSISSGKLQSASLCKSSSTSPSKSASISPSKSPSTSPSKSPSTSPSKLSNKSPSSLPNKTSNKPPSTSATSSTGKKS